ncbi:response regulator [Clostridium akagii]|uniref:response regulator n=1 Tax=Clostridium akagii TaxID=91623 RepID=UPI00068DF74E|nr:response regulator [Clostridium akagii]
MDNTKVLFVDDEVKILHSIRRGILGEKFIGLYAESGKDALKIMNENDISVIVTDMRMPEMNGLELLQIVKEKYPNTLRIVLSGYAQISQVLATVNKVGVFKYIAKPWDLEEDFLVGIRQAVDYYNLQKINKELRKALETKNILYKNMIKSFEDKTVGMKISLEKFVELNDYFIRSISLLESKIGKDSIIINNYRNAVKDFYSYYIDSVLGVHVNFNVKRIEEDLGNYIIKTHEQKMINVKFQAINEFTINGDYKLLFAVLASIVNSIIQNFYKENRIELQFMFSTEELKEKNVLSVVIRLQTAHSENINITHLNVLSAFLNEILKKTNGYINCSGNSHENLEITVKNRY